MTKNALQNCSRKCLQETFLQSLGRKLGDRVSKTGLPQKAWEPSSVKVCSTSMGEVLREWEFFLVDGQLLRGRMPGRRFSADMEDGFWEYDVLHLLLALLRKEYSFSQHTHLSE